MYSLPHASYCVGIMFLLVYRDRVVSEIFNHANERSHLGDTFEAHAVRSMGTTRPVS